VAEGASINVLPGFVRHGGQPSSEVGILDGHTRAKVIDL